MNFLFIINHMKMGGAEKINYEIIKTLSEHNNVILITLENGFEFDICELKNVKIIQFNQKKLNLLNLIFCISKCGKIIKNFKPDIILSSNSKANIVAGIAGIKSNSKIILWEHAIISNHLNRFTKLFVKLAYSLSHGIIAVSEACKRDLVENLGIQEEKITVIPDFVKIQENSHNKINMPEFPEKTVKIVSIGNLTPQKNYKNAMRVIKILADKGYNVVYFIGGEGKDRKYLEDLINSLNLADRIFLLGKINNPFNLLSVADIYLNSSLSESFGLSIAEAIASGVPVVCADNPGALEILNNGEFGLIAEKNNPEKIAEKLEYYINNPLEMIKYAKKAKTRANIYSFENFTKRFNDYISGIIETQ